jgi:hypothetical protein
MDSIQFYDVPSPPFFVEEEKCREIPDELLVRIFSYLPIQSFAEIPQVCRQWRRVARDDEIWKIIAARNHFIVDASHQVIHKSCVSEGLFFDATAVLEIEGHTIIENRPLPKERRTAALENLFRTSVSIPLGSLVWSATDDADYLIVKEMDGSVGKLRAKLRAFVPHEKRRVFELYKLVHLNAQNSLAAYREFSLRGIW